MEFPDMSAANNPSRTAAPGHPAQSSKTQHDSTLDFYSLLFALFVLVSPWLFAYASSPARLDFWASGVLIAVASVAAIVAFSEWEEWLNVLLGM